jgi:hypothetical protein
LNEKESKLFQVVAKIGNSQDQTPIKRYTLYEVVHLLQLIGHIGGSMKASLKIILPACLLLLSGCAQIVTKTYAPNRGGTVKYNTGWFMADKNREKAIEEIKQYCGPRARPQILRENSKLEGTGQVFTNGSTKGNSYSSTSTESKEANMYIQFNCVKSQKTARR